MAPLAFLTGPRLLAVDRGKGLVTRAGSALPLIRNVTVFALQYGVAVMAALQLDGHAAVDRRPRDIRRDRGLFPGMGGGVVA